MPADAWSTSERAALARTAADFVARHVRDHLAGWEDDGQLPAQLSADAAAHGLLGVGYPEAVGGQGGGLIEQSVVTEAVIGAGGSGGLIASLFTHGIAIPHVIDEADRRRGRGDPAGARLLEERFVRPVLQGRAVASLAVTEPGGGSDVAALRTTARPVEATGTSGAHVVVEGTKTFITSAVRADFFVVAARTGGAGAAGVSLVVVPSSAPGVRVGRPLRKMGWHCSDTAEITFDSVRVPADHVLGPEQGFASLARHFLTERLSLAVTGYATAQRCLDLTARWTRDRTTFGRPLQQRQVVRHTLVQMHRRTDVAREYTRSVIRAAAAEPPLGPSGQPAPDLIARAVLAKQTAVEACDWVVDRAVQLHGGMGFMRESEVERHYRDSKVLAIGGGATEVMTDLAARILGYAE